MNSRVEDRRLNCTIHLIQAESGELESSLHMTQAGWAELTSSFHCVRGSGRHMQMLEEPNVAENSALVLQALESIVPSEPMVTLR